MNKTTWYIGCGLLMTAISCDKFINLDAPKSELVNTAVFTDDKAADAAVRGMYYEIVYNLIHFASGGGNGGFTQLCGLSADELTYNLSVAEPLALYTNNLLSTHAFIYNAWSSGYKTIYEANGILEGLTANQGVSETVSYQLRGEALFMRAFCYFYLTNAFGDIPLLTGTDYRVNNQASRSSADDIYTQLTADLIEASKLLPADFAGTKGLRVRPILWAARAMLARVYLYRKQWEQASAEASAVIAAESLFTLESNLDLMFLKTSREAIFQLKAVANGRETSEAFTAIPSPTQATPPAYSLSPSLMAAMDPGDQRGQHWVGHFTPVGSATVYTYPYKYKVRTSTNTADAIEARTEYSMVLRLAEQYLIRAEARLHLNDISGARDDLNAIRVQHGGLEPLTTDDPEVLMAAVEKERFIEFFYEWGHRWFDLKRWNKADAVLSPLKPLWKPTAVWYPIPEKELLADPNLQ
ncbi:SusD family protein [bacterium A37T11]|nr:SusD family protein [bacterium A37T11]